MMKINEEVTLETVVGKAASLLLSGKNVQETSRLLGYDDYYFFIRCFKKVHGITPGQYVKQPEIP